jgi:carbon monoxide dehydrogenase subunit G
MEITDVATPTALGLRLSFLKPFKAENRIDFDLRPEGDGTRVTWRLTGAAKGVTKVFARFGMFDRWVGKDFEKGLARLRAEVS